MKYMNLKKWRNAVVATSATGLALIPTVSHRCIDTRS
ncbi:Uncharacterised protein [Kingella kingae]|nr:Uncharacterised protein [Kingella kingae]